MCRMKLPLRIQLDVVRDKIDVGKNVFAMTSISDKIELEAISNNVNEDIWSQE